MTSAQAVRRSYHGICEAKSDRRDMRSRVVYA